MKKVIDGKVYNTETAQLIHEWWDHYGQSDFHYCYEALYRTKKGAYFLAGEGNGLSKYAKRFIDGWGPGSGINPISEQEALEWMETHQCDVDTVKINFAHLISEA
jgi:hypothetical protein